MSLTLRQWIQGASKQSLCQFNLQGSGNEHIDFYQAEDENYDRFLVVFEINHLSESAVINQLVIEAAPEALISQPSFAKNTDLILLFKHDNLPLSKDHERQIYGIEEDSYSFKKQVLYYTENEQKLFANEPNTADANWLHNAEQFKKYSDKPEEESAYALFVRLYIKLPFLSVPAVHKELADPIDIANEKVEEKGLLVLSQKINTHFAENEGKSLEESGKALNKLIEELVNDRMAPEPDKD